MNLLNFWKIQKSTLKKFSIKNLFLKIKNTAPIIFYFQPWSARTKTGLQRLRRSEKERSPPLQKMSLRLKMTRPRRNRRKSRMKVRFLTFPNYFIFKNWIFPEQIEPEYDLPDSALDTPKTAENDNGQLLFLYLWTYSIRFVPLS